MRNGNRVFASNSGIKVLDPSRRRWDPWVDAGKVGTTVHLIPGPGESIYAASLIRGVTQIGKDGKVLAQSTYGPGGARLAGDGNRHTWLAGTGITLVTKKGERLELTPQGMGSGVSLDMEYDAKRNALWACHEREVILFEGNQWTHITSKDGLLDDYCRSIAVLPGAEVWVGYAHFDSLSRIRRSTSGTILVDTFSYDSKAHNADYTFLDADSRGWLWWATGGRDYVATPSAAAQGNWVALDAEDGIPVPGGNQNSFFGDTDGSIWFASENTVVHFTPPDDFATRLPQPALFIAGFSFGSGGATLADALVSVPRSANVVAHIGSLQFDRRNALRIRYRLLPEQATWVYTSNLNPSLGKLRWGHHTLQVQAQLGNGPWSPVEEQSIRVLWPLWLSWPALLLMGTTCTGIGIGAVQWRRRRIFQREMVLPDLSAWRMEALSPETERLIGTLIDDRYEIGHILSVGGFATVARARDLHEEGRLCAIKIFRYELADQVWVRHRFAHEVAALQQLSHPNIVKVTGHGVIDTGAPFLVMEFIHGRSLRELLEQGGLPRKQIAAFLQQIASALQLLHRSMIFHRDLKPENLMIRFDGGSEEQIVVIDFSIAIVKSRDQTFHGISRVAGTLDYMAPEQVIGYADAGTDIYSLAKIVMEMLTGLRWTELFQAATLDLPDQIRGYFATHRDVFKEDSIDLLVAALAFDPANRPKDANEFARPLVRDLNDGP